jgi:hypothetical protein
MRRGAPAASNSPHRPDWQSANAGRGHPAPRCRAVAPGGAPPLLQRGTVRERSGVAGWLFGSNPRRSSSHPCCTPRRRAPQGTPPSPLHTSAAAAPSRPRRAPRPTRAARPRPPTAPPPNPICTRAPPPRPPRTAQTPHPAAAQGPRRLPAPPPNDVSPNAAPPSPLWPQPHAARPAGPRGHSPRRLLPALPPIRKRKLSLPPKTHLEGQLGGVGLQRGVVKVAPQQPLDLVRRVLGAGRHLGAAGGRNGFCGAPGLEGARTVGGSRAAEGAEAGGFPGNRGGAGRPRRRAAGAARLPRSDPSGRPTPSHPTRLEAAHLAGGVHPQEALLVVE